MKTCFKCGETKAFAEFYAHAMMADGYLNKCKECTRKDAKATRLARLGYYQEYDRARGRTEERKARVREYGQRIRKVSPEILHTYVQRHRQANPEKYKARTAMSNAIRDGRLERQPCERCGDPETHGHHRDYSKPLDVQWLCRKHHGEEHRIYS